MIDILNRNRIKNVTNGIAYRRWLLASNPELCKLLDETIGTGYKHDAADLSKLNKFAEDKTVLKRLNEIKLDNKKNFAAYLEKSTGQVIDPNSEAILEPTLPARIRHMILDENSKSMISRVV